MGAVGAKSCSPSSRPSPPGEGEGETSAAGLTDRGGFGGWGGESGICRTYGAGGSVGNAYYRYDAPTELGKGAISAEKM